MATVEKLTPAAAAPSAAAGWVTLVVLLVLIVAAAALVFVFGFPFLILLADSLAILSVIGLTFLSGYDLFVIGRRPTR